MPDADETLTEHFLEQAVGALGGTPREGQRAMAVAVCEAIADTEHLIVQAGTGTGKSLAYLAPAVCHAVTSGERVVIATATLALQRQLLTRDLPLLADQAQSVLARTISYAVAKGWHHYICRHKLTGGYPQEEPGLFSVASLSNQENADGTSSLGDQVVRIRQWAAETETGDRDDLVPGVSDRAWRQASVTALECLGQRCPELGECFPERARAAAREADIVVTNHAMLGVAALGSTAVLPDHDVVIIDEAHELADRITTAATAELSVPNLEVAARLVRRQGGVATDQMDAAIADFATTVSALPATRFPEGLPPGMLVTLEALRDAARLLISELKPATGVQQAATPDTGLKVAQAAVTQIFDIAERMIAADSHQDVLWCSRPGDWAPQGDGFSRLLIAPLTVSGLIQHQVLAERTGVFTSATLSLGGSFDAVARSVGLGHSKALDQELADPPSWRGIDVGSPFNYSRQGILYVARHLPAPGREPTTQQQFDEIASLIAAAQGRTLGLFSSRRAAVAAAEAMRERIDTPILCQGDDQLPTLIEQFAGDPNTSLFGTLSLWQGVDVPGPSCQLVLIDRIPFPRPDDPVTSARIDAVTQAGGNGFMEVSATHAALRLAQGAGRLIRTMDDRGVVAVLDPRLVTSRYGKFLVESMPPLWLTTDLQVACAALQRLVAVG